MKKDIKPLTSLRGFGALLIAFGHYHEYYGVSGGIFFSTVIVPYAFLIIEGFFVLSGFIIFYVYYEDFLSFKSGLKSFGKFMTFRFARVYPLHLATLLLTAGMVYLGIEKGYTPFSQLTNSNDLRHFIYNIFLVQGWGITTTPSFNTISWTISVEWLIYLTFPFLTFIFSRINKHSLNLAVIYGILLILYVLYPDYDPKTTVFLNNPARGAAFFIIGMCLYNLYRNNFLEKLNWDIILTIIILISIGGAFLHLPYSVLAFSVPVIMYSLTRIDSFATRLFCNKFTLHLGEVSYSIYLLHAPFVFIMDHVYFKNSLDGGQLWGWPMVILIVGLILLSSLSYNLIEKPCRTYIKRRYWKRQEKKNGKK